MRRHCKLAIVVAIVPMACRAASVPEGYAHYGAPFNSEKALTLGTAVAAVDEYGGSTVCVQGEVKEVCQKMGCWMMIGEGSQAVRVRFTASAQCTDGFFVPRNAAGHDALVYGVLNREDIPESMARHYAEDAGQSPEDIAKIVGPQPAVTMVATGVAISDATKLDAPVR